MTPEQYAKQQRKNHREATRARAGKLLEKAYKAREVMALHTNKAIAERYNQSVGMISDMRNGHEPVKMPALIRRKIRTDLMRHDEAAKDYLSLDEIALHLEVSRSLVRKWTKEFGLAEIREEKASRPKTAKPVAFRWPGTPIGRFAVMRLSRNPSEVRTYY